MDPEAAASCSDPRLREARSQHRGRPIQRDSLGVRGSSWGRDSGSIQKGSALQGVRPWAEAPGLIPSPTAEPRQTRGVLRPEDPNRPPAPRVRDHSPAAVERARVHRAAAERLAREVRRRGIRPVLGSPVGEPHREGFPGYRASGPEPRGDTPAPHRDPLQARRPRGRRLPKVALPIPRDHRQAVEPYWTQPAGTPAADCRRKGKTYWRGCWESHTASTESSTTSEEPRLRQEDAGKAAYSFRPSRSRVDHFESERHPP